MNAGILTIGDEILIGQISNTNAAWMGQELLRIGVNVRGHRVVGDESGTIQSSFLQMLDEYDVVLVTGGLGPTHDDITVEAIAKALRLELIEDSEWIEKMRAYFKSKAREMPENNRKQAMRPQASERIDNDCGTAPGLWLDIKGRCVALLPGVPYEMKSMMEREVLPRLQRLNQAKSGGSRRFMWNIYTTGIGESALAQKFEDIEKLHVIFKEDLELAWLPSPQGVKLRLLARAMTLEEAEKVKDRFFSVYGDVLKPYLLGITDSFDEIKIEAVLGDLLAQKQKTLALAESCTGGLVSSRMTDIAGSSRYILGGVVSYHRSIKEKFLDVSAALINAHGEVSEQVARAMAEGARKGLEADYGVGVTGIAGPGGGTADKPVGTVWIAVSDTARTEAKCFVFEQDRLRNKLRFSQAALDFLRRFLTETD